MESLASVKSALDAGLITVDEYARAKDWFLFTHKIAQANASGVLSASDVDGVRRAMLRAMREGALSVSGDVERLLCENVGDGEELEVLRETTTREGRFNVEKSAAARPTFMTKIGGVQEESDGKDGDANERSEAPVAPPPSAPAPAPAATGKSLSGVAVTDDCLTVFNKVKMRTSDLQWATFRVEETEGSVLTAATGAVDGAYEDFVAALPEDDCRYAVYDYRYVNSEECEFRKLVFIVWNPDSARLKSKMLYASTKDFFKGRLSGIAVEIQATDYDEVSEEELRENIGGILTRK
tara:strand:+ start:5273 stop:6157 length:885 start_codon:yes stop_codon:yes gene_type:complete